MWQVIEVQKWTHKPDVWLTGHQFPCFISWMIPQTGWPASRMFCLLVRIPQAGHSNYVLQAGWPHKPDASVCTVLYFTLLAWSHKRYATSLRDHMYVLYWISSFWHMISQPCSIRLVDSKWSYKPDKNIVWLTGSLLYYKFV